MKDDQIIRIIATIDWSKETAFETLIEEIKKGAKKV